MFPVSEDGEVFGGEVLNLSVIAASVFVLLAALWSPAPEAAQASVEPAEQVVVAAHPGHTS